MISLQHLETKVDYIQQNYSGSSALWFSLTKLSIIDNNGRHDGAGQCVCVCVTRVKRGINLAPSAAVPVGRRSIKQK